MEKFFLINMFVYSCNAQNNNFYNSIMCNYRVMTPQIVDEDLWLLLRKQRHDTSPRAEVYVMTKAVVQLQESLSSLSHTIVKSLAIPRQCVAADCKTTSGMEYSLHSFPTDENMR